MGSRNPEIRSGEIFKHDFLEAFPPKKHLGKLFSNAALLNSDRCNTYDAYVYEKITLLRNLHAHWEETFLIELVIHGIQGQDVRIKASNNNFKTIPELMSFIFSVTKRQKSESSILEKTESDNLANDFEWKIEALIKT